MKDDRLPKIVLVCQLSRAKRKAGRSVMAWENVVRKNLRETVALWEGVKREALN